MAAQLRCAECGQFLAQAHVYVEDDGTGRLVFLHPCPAHPEREAPAGQNTVHPYQQEAE